MYTVILLYLQRRSIEKIISIKTSNPPSPKDWFSWFTYLLVISPYFDWTIFAVVLVDICLIISQLAVSDNLATVVFRYINCVIVGVYTSEFILKVYIMKWSGPEGDRI